MISVSNVTMRYGQKLLFEDVSVTFTSGRRYGLTGPNGAGKSTFMKVLTGEIDAQKGTVVRPKKIGVLSQDQYAFDEYRVIDTVIMGNKPFGQKLLFEDVSVTFTSGRRYGLTGPNGAGKSTFMKVLTGEIDAQKGNVVRPKKIGVLSQDQYAFDAVSRGRYRDHGEQAAVGGAGRARDASTTSPR